MKFRKKPVVIEAVQFTKDSIVENVFRFDFESEKMSVSSLFPVYLDESNERYVQITTKEGVMRGSLGDWIIRGVKGEFYPCKPDNFEATYEPI